MWGLLLHMGINMWSDVPVTRWGQLNPEDVHVICQADHLRFDEAVWGRITARMHQAGMNTVVIDLGEALQYQTHPELAVQGSWEIGRFRKELARLRALGLEPIPKLNFSAAHDAWLKDYSRQLSTPVYYKVCADLIGEVCEIFDTPRLFHLGYDEETAGHQSRFAISIVRQGELWWHDFLFMVKQVEQHGARPWIWSDYHWNHPEEFISRMPRSVLQSNWFYGAALEGDALNPNHALHVASYRELEKAGFDQVPTGSNWSNDVNFGNTVDYCRKVIAPERLKGFLQAPWFFTLPQWEQKLAQAVNQVQAKIG
jgi:hypothetical protein